MMVRSLHAAGIEVILDVVYNHTCEGNQLGPTLSWRGIDNASYYRLSPEDPRYYTTSPLRQHAGMTHPRVLQMIWTACATGSRRCTSTASASISPARSPRAARCERLGAFFDIIHQDPILSQVKLIATLGRRPRRFIRSQLPCSLDRMNGKYRDSVRRFWKGDGGSPPNWPRASPAAAIYTKATAAAPTPASIHHRPRWLLPPGFRLLRPQAQRRQRRRQPRRRR